MDEQELNSQSPEEQVLQPHVSLDRRTFLRLAGFTFAGGLLSGCQQSPVEKAIPLLLKPEEVTPGLATWYTTTCGGCSAGCGVLAKCRDGRPIKLEGNPRHPVSRGGLCAAGQASLLPLYDSQRLRHPVSGGHATTWQEVDGRVTAALAGVKKKGGAVRVLSGTITSPTTREIIRRFLDGFEDGKHVVYDALSSSAILDAHRHTHGRRLLPHYLLAKAEVILSVDADFLGTWVSPVEFTAAYRSGRSLSAPGQRFSHHIQVESRLSLTGSSADRRICRSPLEMRALIRELVSHLERRAGSDGSSRVAPSGDPAGEEIANRLWEARGKSLVLCGLNDLHAQVLVNSLNHLLGNYGNTLDINRPSHQRQGNDHDVQALAEELRAGAVDVLIVQGVNPAYDLPVRHLGLNLKNVPLVVCFAERIDETAESAHVVCPEPHPLERWNDAEAVAGIVSVAQPAILPFGDTRTLAEALAAWMGAPQQEYELIRNVWQQMVFRRQSLTKDFAAFWDNTLLDGWAAVSAEQPAARPFNRPGQLPPVAVDADTEGLYSLVLYPSVQMHDGRHAHNPWLQELPDPVTKIVWDNYVSVSPAAAHALGVTEEDVLRMEIGPESLDLPVHVQIGQHDRVLSVALGYGRKGTDRFAGIGPQWIEARPTVDRGDVVGKNAAPLIRCESGCLRYDVTVDSVKRAGRRFRLASAQQQQSLEVPEDLARHVVGKRPIVQETTYGAWRRDPSSGSFGTGETASLWPDEHTSSGHHWGMVIDLSACTGCSACVIACVAENNTPVVGKDEVGRNRPLQWLRIDRYVEEVNGQVSAAHQPMMCQHCGNAPCETVCPVLATVHSEEGLNQQVYNRCVGTRYCSNNCPYKVRRFNWFDYDRGDDRQRLVLNPDVVTRERGVMEKCTLCVQRIQEAKIKAKQNGVDLKDGDIQPACAQSCPAQAIVFGDMKDPASRVSLQKKDPRHYRVLEEIGVEPSVGYLTLVRNRNEEEQPHA